MFVLLIFFTSFLHFEGFKLDVALGTALVVFLSFTGEPAFDAIRMHEVPADRYSLESGTVGELFHTDDAFLSVELVVVDIELDVFKLAQKLFNVVLLKLFQLSLHRRVA